MLISKIRNSEREQKLIVGCNIFNSDEMKDVTVPGMDYTLNIDFERLTMGYVENILTRVHVYNEKIVLILNVNDSNDSIANAGKKIFDFTNSICVNRLIEGSTFTVYHNTIVKDRLYEFTNIK